MNDNILISLGTNLGLKEKNLNQAMFLLEDFLRIKKKSNIYYSEPWGYSSKNTFLNMGVLGSTDLEPTELLHSLKKIESQMGREFSDQIEYQDRVIDLDILAYETKSVDILNLKIPHPQLFARKFVLVTWAEISPDFMVQDYGRSVSELLSLCPDTSSVRNHKLEKTA
jgi:2-amino-4-hydroxy-6-hydroxymethyldihydropteridine diphosphokinase